MEAFTYNLLIKGDHATYIGVFIYSYIFLYLSRMTEKDFAGGWTILVFELFLLVVVALLLKEPIRKG